MAHEQDHESCFSDQLLGQVGTLYPGPPELRAEVDDAGVRSLIVSGPGPVLGSYPTAAQPQPFYTSFPETKESERWNDKGNIGKV